MSTTAREKVSVPSRGAAKHQRLFEDVARRFYAGVYNYLCWISRDTALAEDLTQETFMQVWRHLPELRNERAARAWIYRVARNQFLQHQRRSGVETVALDDCAALDFPDTTSPAPQVRLEQAALRRAVRLAVDKLADAHREVIVLHNLEGLSLVQVGQVLDIPLGTVKSRRARAFSELRHLLQKEVRSDEV